MDLHAFFEFDNADSIAPVGLRFGMKPSGADLYVLEVIGDEDSPIRLNGKILAFNDEHGCRRAMERLEVLLPQRVKPSHKYDFICDFPGAIELVTKDDVDRDAVVLNCINTMLDFVETGLFKLPHEYDILRTVADHLTFREELEPFKGSRSTLRDALMWCAGNAVIDLRVIGSVAEFEIILPGLSVDSRRVASNGASPAERSTE